MSKYQLNVRVTNVLGTSGMYKTMYFQSVNKISTKGMCYHRSCHFRSLEDDACSIGSAFFLKFQYVNKISTKGMCYRFSHSRYIQGDAFSYRVLCRTLSTSTPTLVVFFVVQNVQLTRMWINGRSINFNFDYAITFGNIVQAKVFLT